MRYGSVCSGIEAASVAWEPLGWTPAWFSEIEPFPSAVLTHHWPQVPNLGDFTAIRYKIAAGDVEAPDVLVGGTPCQAFSVAGLRASMDDKRGQLTLEFVRLADAIDSDRNVRGLPAAIVVWENVPGVLTTKDNAFGCFLGALAGEDVALEPPGGKWTNAGVVVGPARTIAWRVLDAQYFGVAQRRRRVFVVASARDWFCPDEVLFEFEGLRRDSPPRREPGQGFAPVAGTLAANGGGVNRPAGNANELDFCVPVAPPLLASGRGTERIGGTRGHGCVVAVPEIAATLRSGSTSPKAHGKLNGTDRMDLVVHAVGFNARQDPDFREGLTGPLDTDGSTQAVCATGDVFHTLRAEGFDASEDGTGRGTGAVAVALSLHENQRHELTLSETAGTVKCAGGKPGQGYPAALVGMQVRRLTPTECERLQGFPDGHTRIPWPVVNDGGSYQCQKRLVRATVRTGNGRYFVATNHRQNPTPCPREGMPTSQGYKLCRDVCGQVAHAEINALRLAGRFARGATLYVEGHTYACDDCLEAGRRAGIVEVVIGSPPADCPDGPRYKALGNSMCVAVMQWIGERIAKKLEEV